MTSDDMNNPTVSSTISLSSVDTYPPDNYVEIYGFVAWIATIILFYIYLYWAFSEESTTHVFPSREWALLAASWVICLVPSLFASYVALNWTATPGLGERCLVSDANPIVSDLSMRRGCLADVSLVEVNRALYGRTRPRARAALGTSGSRSVKGPFTDIEPPGVVPGTGTTSSKEVKHRE